MANKTFMSLTAKSIKLILNVIIVIMYRHGDQGFFLGASFNKNRDHETLAAGVYIGYLIYNLAVFVSLLLDRESATASVTETIMNAVGFFLWVITAGVVIHYWISFIPANHYISRNPAPVGIAMGAMTILASIVYLADTIVTFMQYRKAESQKY